MPGDHVMINDSRRSSIRLPCLLFHLRKTILHDIMVICSVNEHELDGTKKSLIQSSSHSVAIFFLSDATYAKPFAHPTSRSTTGHQVRLEQPSRCKGAHAVMIPVRTCSHV